MSDTREGDVRIDRLVINSSRGSAEMAKLCLSASVFESIFQPGIVADFKVIDFDDVLGSLILVGDETVNFTFTVPKVGTADYTFALHKIEGIESPSMRSKTYMVRCVSEEALHAKTNYVQKSYETLISTMIQDIHKTYLKSSKSLFIEGTRGPQRIVIPSFSPYKAIDMLRRRAVSTVNKSSMFLYFENQDGFNFRTVENMFKQSAARTFVQSDAVGHDALSSHFDNILAYTVPQLTSSIDRIKHGMKKRVIQFNFRTHRFEMKDVNVKDMSMTSGGTGSYNSAEFIAKFATGVKIPPFVFVPSDTSQKPVTGITESSADQGSYLATMMQNVMNIKVYGDPNLRAGNIINCAIPRRIAGGDNKELDPLLSGDFLCTRLHHEILGSAAKPRYTCTLELVKGGMETGV